jgi:glycine/D-amino acid oxidase-like deaminating enzyme
MKAMIVGAGIGGLTAAIALRRAGVETTVFERAGELREVGAGLLLARGDTDGCACEHRPLRLATGPKGGARRLLHQTRPARRTRPRERPACRSDAGHL